jgi:hypothetical protein
MLTPSLLKLREHLQNVTSRTEEENSLLIELNLIDYTLERAREKDNTIPDIWKKELPPGHYILGPQPGKCPVCGAQRKS